MDRTNLPPFELEIEAAYRRYGATVLRRAASILASQELAWEVLQEVFLSLLTRPEQFGAQSSLMTWLYSATTHLCLNRLRNRRTRSNLLAQEAAASNSSFTPDPEARIFLGRWLETLGADTAEAAVYFYLDRMTYDEIATVMGCSRRKVANLLSRLKEQVREGEVT